MEKVTDSVILICRFPDGAFKEGSFQGIHYLAVGTRDAVVKRNCSLFLDFEIVEHCTVHINIFP